MMKRLLALGLFKLWLMERKDDYGIVLLVINRYDKGLSVTIFPCLVVKRY